MNKAFNLRGTNGSGKTFVARQLIAQSSAKPVDWAGKKPILYLGSIYGHRIYFLGSYEANCGGCDTIPSVHIVADMLKDIMDAPGEGIVFYEGLMISHMIGTVGAAVKPYGDRHIMAFLDTPLHVCIARVVKRRMARGNDKPFDPNRTLVKDHAAVKKARFNAMKQGFKVIDIDYKLAVEEVSFALRQLLK